jgi:hypothetical protein
MTPVKEVAGNILGGLGNQFFQIFTTIAYALRTGRKAIFSNVHIPPKQTIRSTYWDTIFNEVSTLGMLIPPEEIDAIETKYREHHHTYTPIPDIPDEERVMLCGYFQSPYFFQEEYNIIIVALGLPKKREEIRMRYSGYFQPNHTTISMHFRRGDYKNFVGIHPILPDCYYSKALRTMVEGKDTQIDEIDVLYFCEEEDNIEIAKVVEGFGDEFPMIRFVKVEDTIVDWEQLLLMSCCNHHILANSTFRWWGAYLNEGVDKIVCYPDCGVVVHFDTVDFYPKEWTLIV